MPSVPTVVSTVHSGEFAVTSDASACSDVPVPMSSEQRQRMLARPRQALILVASVVIVIAGMRAASSLLLTALIALFITIMVIPLLRKLQRIGVPTLASIAIVMLSVLSTLAAFGVVLTRSIQDTLLTLAAHPSTFDETLSSVTAALNRAGIAVTRDGLAEVIANAGLMDKIGPLAGQLLSLMTNVVFVTVMVGFMLAESSGLHRKLDLALGSLEERRRHFTGAITRVRRYVWIKSLVSIATGVLAGVSCWIAGVEAPLLWGLIAFGLNYIPMLGSLIAAIPPVLLALDSSPLVAAGLAAAYIAINIVMAEIVEPHVLADRIGLSPAVILLSLLFWGWVFGAIGMLLAVPFTMILFAYCDYRDDLRWLAMLLSSRSIIEARTSFEQDHSRPPAMVIVSGPPSGSGAVIA